MHPSKILKELGISPLKKLGQNFQIDTHVVENVSALIPAGAVVLEIGPGLGAWTEIFLRRGHKMVLAEKDRTLAARLAELYAGSNQVEVLSGDFLEMDTGKPPLSTVTAAIGNLPFYVTSDILLRIIVEMPQVTHALFGVQLEVAERLAQGKGSSLAIALAAQGKISTAGKISRSSFYPAPNVDAAIIAFERTAAPVREHLRLLLVAAFWGKRKTLRTSLRTNPFWKESPVGEKWSARLANPLPGPAGTGIAALLNRRADDLSVAEFCALYDFLNT